jgi:hypothetical protein
MITNKIPTTIPEIVSLGVKALAGAQAYGDDVDLGQNTAPKIAADLYDLTGDPATPLVPGKQDLLNAARAAVTTAYANAGNAVKAGREYCRLGLALLKPTLGTRHNALWTNAGFLTPSLALPNDPVPMLMAFRQYFVANPTKENAPTNITAANAQTLLAAVQGTTLALATARDGRRDALAARDGSKRNLQTRLSGLRSELDQLLDDDDGRWEQFGFRRPADGSMPLPVPDLVLTPGGAGIVLAQWGLASLADNYRVSWRIAGSADEPNEIGLFTERQATLTALPSGANIVVLVTARNESGETVPTEAAIVVP